MDGWVSACGPDGIGRARAERCLGRGYVVVVVGRDATKGKEFLDIAGGIGIGAGARAHFVRADLSLVGENAKLLEWITATFPVVDVLVLCARYHRSVRSETPEGFESTFALFYLSRFLLSHGLVEQLERTGSPVILNVAGPGGTSDVQWDDLQLERGYFGTGALGHGGRLNDLLGVSFTDTYKERRICSVSSRYRVDQFFRGV
ncbi:SDR family NAD(P)-dependent oxidoreductase [Protofrankia symbiont of Coriaria ruscifolia]|uniref:SDR family NAD(P)-dependent oxidoreductase n=1 Tax=Protofrankia symbiont of Coriaria ruscifolia TaxID=1306542 RepID=UPI001F5FBB9B|nr:SDR family NAD(P)-dependent oxidoreductase [Protofrankia symbiont of Coriaria ruscifolia]